MILQKQQLTVIKKSIPLFFFSLLFPIYYYALNFNFYLSLFEKNGTFLFFNDKTLIHQKGKEIINCINGISCSLDTSFFSNQAILHMKDIQFLFSFLKIILIACLLFIGIHLFTALTKKQLISLKKSFILSGSISLILIVILSIALFFFWTPLFIFFHNLFFQNNLWLFPPDDTLILLFPDSFFIQISSAIG